MPDLFNIPPTLSPRLAWIKKHGVTIHCSKLLTDDDLEKYAAYIGDETEAIRSGRVGFGQTEDEALVDLAKLLGVPLWNEERFVL